MRDFNVHPATAIFSACLRDQIYINWLNLLLRAKFSCGNALRDVGLLLAAMVRKLILILGVSFFWFLVTACFIW